VNWTLNSKISLRNDRVADEDADRQERTAAEILRRLEYQPGLVLADEVGMGKTYVALAVAVSVLEATRRRRPVVVMVPPAVADKWPTEWAVFSQMCLPSGHGIRASKPVRKGSEFLKLLDDPASTRSHLIFMTHGALTSNLNDPFIRLALLRRAMLRRPDLAKRRRVVARFASQLLNDRRFNEDIAAALLETPDPKWRDEWERWRPQDPLTDDPVPAALGPALKQVDLNPLREALAAVPVQRNSTFRARMQSARKNLNEALNNVWTASLGGLSIHLPLLVLDEAHHVKNPNQLSRLFDNEDAEHDAEVLQGPLGGMFDKMVFLTATPFQLGHHELLSVLSRFHGVRWPSASARAQFDEQCDHLRSALDRAQAMSLRLERAWSRIDSADAPLVAGLQTIEAQEGLPEAVSIAMAVASEAQADIVEAELLLRPWVIRHVKPNKEQRRRYFPGRSILDEVVSDVGIPVDGAATLPFLLAARAEAIASLLGQDGGRSTRGFFAYGLASSFEAYAETRSNRPAKTDDLDRQPAVPIEVPSQLRWYIDRINAALPRESSEGWAAHPKVAATVHRVLELWRTGEKALVFCFYVETGRALRAHISRALRQEIIGRSAEMLDMDAATDNEVLAAIDRIGDRLLRSDSRGYEAFRARVRSLAAGLEEEAQEEIATVATRFMRTPSFLIRFVELSMKASVDDLLAGFDRPDGSGKSLADKVESFASLMGQKVDVERVELMTALSGIQTGGIAASPSDFDPSERATNREVLLPNVRLANGGVSRETRRRLMLAFNTPFFPEVLVASSVMAEGVDLHQDCRYVIHHDLDWNPSTLEQRTGRIDRLRSKAELTGKPVMIYEPFLGGTHDEKMYRVVKDRERWFGIVMGEGVGTDERSTELLEARVPLPMALAELMTLDLSLRPPRTIG
jgi:ERCC4-related helicase